MSRRLIAALAAIVIAGVGVVLILSYVGSADQRAMAGLDPTRVLVVTQPVPEGTAAEALSEFVALESVPASAVAPNAVSSLDQIAGTVAETELVPGEQVVAHRFVEPDALRTNGSVDVPPGLHQLTIRLDRTRVLGGQLIPGDTVGVFITLADSPQTHLVEHKVLVTRVEGGVVPAADDGAGTDAAVPAESVAVTLALEAAPAERVVWGAENARIWLSLEDSEAVDTGIRVVTPENIFE